MNKESLVNSKITNIVFRLIGKAMESRFRYRFFEPVKILRGAGIRPGQDVLEVGCGTGFYTIPAAELIGDQGRLTAMDVLPISVERVSEKVRDAGLKNIRVVQGDALDTGLDSECMDVVLLLGVIPAPMLPLNRLLPEMHRVLKPEGILSVWPPVSGWLFRSKFLAESFDYEGKRNGVHNFRRV